MAGRPLSEQEAAVVRRLLEFAEPDAKLTSPESLLAIEMKDGGMGSIRFLTQSSHPRKMGRELVTAEYIDEDRIPVLISVNLDEEGDLFELDFWKVDFAPLKRYPRPEEIYAAPSASTRTCRNMQNPAYS